MIHPLEPRRLLAFAQDVTFGVDGRIAHALGEFQFADSNTHVTFVHALADGKVIVGGSVFGGDEPAVRVARYTPGGLLDTTFGGGDGLSDQIETPRTGNTAGGAVQATAKSSSAPRAPPAWP